MKEIGELLKINEQDYDGHLKAVKKKRRGSNGFYYSLLRTVKY